MQQSSTTAMLLLLACMAAYAIIATHAAIEGEFVASNAELASLVPTRLVFSDSDLASCLADKFASRCVLRAPIKLDESSWRKQLAETDGVAVLTQEQSPITITSGACANCPGLDVPVSSDSLFGGPKLEKLDWNEVAGAIALQPGTKLRLINLHLNNFAYKSAYQPGPRTPFSSVGVGMSIWPTINLGPNTTFVGLNITASFVNPSDVDDCPRYVQKSLSFLIQSYGAGNVSSINPTSNMILGPIIISVPVWNGITEAEVGTATSIYKNLMVVCEEKQPASPTGALAAAIAAPVAAVILASGLMAWWFMRRRRARSGADADSSKQTPHDMLLDGAEKGGSSGGAPQPKVMSSSDIMTAWALAYHNRAQTTSKASAAADEASGALLHQNSLARSTPSRQLLPVARTAVGNHDSSEPSAENISNAQPSLSQAAGRRAQLLAAGSPSRQQSSSTNAPSTPTGTACSLQSQQFSTGGKRSGLGRGRLTGDSCTPDTTTAALKARSDAAVLKDLKLGPLLGQGCYGRVYRGRWKATPVAVKIIDHYSSNEGVGSSRGNRISAGRELLFATSISHPALVNTYHISTLSASQRPLASSVPTGGASTALALAAGSRRRTSSSSAASSGGDSNVSDEAQSQTEQCETWIVMEYCEKGSLERAMKQGKLKKQDGRPDLVAIYKALLDTASGLDYLHSIGVVHGDLKAANVLLKGSTKDPKGCSCKITDFGLSRVLDMNASHVSTGTHGTIVYMPKELLLSGRMTQATDIYSFGLMMWELLTSRHIMESDEGMSVGQMFYMIAYQDWRPEIPDNCPPAFAELMTACWHEDPEQRPTAQQLLRRLQVLQGQHRQETVSAKKAHSAAVRAAEQGLGYAESAPSGSEAAGQPPYARCLSHATGSLGSGAAGSVDCSCCADQDEDGLRAASQPQLDVPVHEAPLQQGMAPAGAGSSREGRWGAVQAPDAPQHPQQVWHVIKDASSLQQQGRQQQQGGGDCWAAAPDSCESNIQEAQSGDLPPAHTAAWHAMQAATPASSLQHETTSSNAMFVADVEGQPAEPHDTFEGYLGSTTLTEQQLQAMQCTLAIHQHMQAEEAGLSAQLSIAAASDLPVPEQYLQSPAGGALLHAGTTPVDSTQWESQPQRQWTAAPFNACAPELGFVSPYGQEFAGCLPQFNDDGTGNSAIMQAYISALDAAAAARRASGYTLGPG